MNVDQRAQAGDARGPYQRSLVRARAIIRRVNGSDDRNSIERWIGQCPDNVLLLLGMYGDAITDGEDPEAVQREMFRVVPNLADTRGDQGDE